MDLVNAEKVKDLLDERDRLKRIYADLIKSDKVYALFTCKDYSKRSIALPNRFKDEIAAYIKSEIVKIEEEIGKY